MNRVHLLALAIILLLGVLLWLLYPRLAALIVTKEPALLWQVEAESDCDLHRQACRITLPDGRWVELSMGPGPIRVLVPFAIRVQAPGLELKTITVDLNGVDMNMGFNRPILKPTGDGHFEGNGLLPMCVLDRMTWRAQVLLDTPEGRGIAVFYFDTTRRGGS